MCFLTYNGAALWNLDFPQATFTLQVQSGLNLIVCVNSHTEPDLCRP